MAVLLVGWALLQWVRDLHAEERLAAAFGVGITVLAGAQCLVFATGLGQRVAAPGVALATLEYLGLFWSQVATASWLDANDVSSLLKATNGLVFLADLLGTARPLAMTALLAVPLALGVLVARRISMERLPARPAD